MESYKTHHGASLLMYDWAHYETKRGLLPTSGDVGSYATIGSGEVRCSNGRRASLLSVKWLLWWGKLQDAPRGVSTTDIMILIGG